MAAETFGEKLLAEVTEENLSELLRDVRTNGLRDSDREPQQSYLGVKPLDDLLQIFLRPRHHHREREEHHEEHTSHRDQICPREPVVEITSPSSGDGKTSLLYYVTAIGALPPSYDGITLGGKAGAVVFLDTDSRFDARRLRDVLICIVRQKLDKSSHGEGNIQPDTSNALELMIDDCLRHVHVFRPQSSPALLSTLGSLESYLLYGSQHVSSSRHLHAIILDSASAFYWQDRREAEVLKIPGVREERTAAASTIDTFFNPTDSSGISQFTNLNTPQIALDSVNTLRHLQRTFSCAVFYSTWGLQRAYPQYKSQSMIYPNSSPVFPSSFRPHLPPPWPTFPALRLVVRRDPVRQFAPYMSIDEARHDASARQSIVARREFSVSVDQWGMDNWLSEIVEKVSAKNIFGLWVGIAGVGICASREDDRGDDK